MEVVKDCRTRTSRAGTTSDLEEYHRFFCSLKSNNIPDSTARLNLISRPVGQNARRARLTPCWRADLRDMPSTTKKPTPDEDGQSKLAGNRPKRCTESRTLESPAFVDFIKRLRNNTLECDAGGKVLRLKRFISANSGPKVLHEVLDALKLNTTVEALYIQNFESGFFDEHLVKLADVLRLKRIWCLNVGENFRTSLPAWKQFTEDLEDTAVSHMYASEHHFIGTDVKHKMKAAIRENRNADPPITNHSLEVIMQCGNMWYNPKLPKWARDIKGGAQTLIERQQNASADSAMCQLVGGVAGESGKDNSKQKVGTSAARDVESFLIAKRNQFRDGKRTVRQTEAGAAHALLESGKRKRVEKLRRERVATKKRDDEALVQSETNSETVRDVLKRSGGSGLVGWKLRVFWPSERHWFYGTVRAFDPYSGKHDIEYEDGDEQTLNLRGGVDKVGFLKAPPVKKSTSGISKTQMRQESTPTRVSKRTPKRRAESPPPPPGGLRGSHGIRAAAAVRRLSRTLKNAPKRARSAR